MVYSQTFLAGQGQIFRAMLESWQKLLPYVIDPSSDVLLAQLQAVQTQIDALLAATPNPKLSPDTIVVPILLILQFKNALDVFEYQFSGANTPPNLYADTRSQLDSTFDQYNITFFSNANRSQPFWLGD